MGLQEKERQQRQQLQEGPAVEEEAERPRLLAPGEIPPLPGSLSRTKSLREQQRRRLSVSVTSVEENGAAAGTAATSSCARLVGAAGERGRGKGPSLDKNSGFAPANGKVMGGLQEETPPPQGAAGMRGTGRGPRPVQRSLSEFSLESRSSEGSRAVTRAALRHEKSLPPPSQQRGLASAAAQNLSAERRQSLVDPEPPVSPGDSAAPGANKGFCPQLPLLFSSLPFAPQDAWMHIEDITAQFLLQHFTTSDEDPMKCAVLGSPAHQRQRGFDNKSMDCVLTNNWERSEFEAFQAQCGVGCSCKKGLKPESPNQDDFSFIRCSAFGVYGVFDGHGPSGHEVSDISHRLLPFMVLSHPSLRTDVFAALRGAFLSTHRGLVEFSAADSSMDSSLSGTTATIVLHEPRRLTVAFVGDSRFVLGKTDAKGAIFPAFSTVDHKPTNPEEKKRIDAAGGEVIRLECDIPHRVFVKDRLFPGLAMSRAIGDEIAHQIGVVSEPEIIQVPLDEDALFFIIASDGVWEFISSEEAIDIVSRYITGSPNDRERMKDAADRLAYEAFRRWIGEEGNVVDDVTVIIVWVRPP